MRLLLAAAVSACAVTSLSAQAPAKRHGLDPDPKTFPQATAKETLASVLKALEMKRVDYLLAHLADPAFVDGRVKVSAGGFGDLVREGTDKLVNDPGAARLLQRLEKEGEWKTDGDSASVALKEGSDKSVTFRKADGRWVMRNQYRPPAVRPRRGR